MGMTRLVRAGSAIGSGLKRVPCLQIPAPERYPKGFEVVISWMHSHDHRPGPVHTCTLLCPHEPDSSGCNPATSKGEFSSET